jgi:hypothetical protein
VPTPTLLTKPSAVNVVLFDAAGRTGAAAPVLALVLVSASSSGESSVTWSSVSSSPPTMTLRSCCQRLFTVFWSSLSRALGALGVVDDWSALGDADDVAVDRVVGSSVGCSSGSLLTAALLGVGLLADEVGRAVGVVEA